MMSHSSESPAGTAKKQLLETLENFLPDLVLRNEVIDLALEEVDRQLSEPDDVMIVAGQELLDAAGGAATASLFYRRKLIEQIWCRMAEKAFGR